MAGEEGGVLFSLRAARRQMLACSLPVIKRPPARLSPALCCAAKRRHAASRCGPWRAPRCRCRCRCRARPGRSPRASAAVAGVWAGCDGACCRTPRAGGGRLTVPHRGRAPFNTLPAWRWGVPLPCSTVFGVRRGTARPSCRQVALGVPSCAMRLERGGGCGVCHAGVVQAAWHCCCPLCCAVPCHAAGLDTRPLLTVPCCTSACTALVPAPSQCC